MQFSLRTLLILVTVFGVWLGIHVNEANRQKRAVEALTEIGADFNYDYQRRPSTGPNAVGYYYSHQVDVPGPEWLHGILGEHSFKTAVSVNFSRSRPPVPVKDDPLIHLKDLPHIEVASVYGLRLRDRDLAHFGKLPRLTILLFGKGTLSGNRPPQDFSFLANCRHLEHLSLRAPKFSDDDLAQLSEATNLTHLFLYYTDVGDEGLASLKQLTKLEFLGLGATRVTDEGLAHLASLVNLKYLSLGKTRVTDAGLRHLESLVKLTDLEVFTTGVTATGAKSLSRKLPGCSISPFIKSNRGGGRAKAK